MFQAQILADSLGSHGDRITTMKVTFPRFILAEFNTHRMFSRNSASSRAIPFKKMVKMVEENPFIPIAWQKDHKGMQGTEYFTDELEIESKIVEWEYARHSAIEHAKELYKKGVTKQLCNRLLEPFMWHTVIVTATEWENFFKLRCPQYTLFNHSPKKEIKVYKSKKEAELDFGGELYQCARELGFDNQDDPMFWFSINNSQAEIHIQAIAEMMWDAYNESTPKILEPEEWHIPFGDNIDNSILSNILYPEVPLPHNIIDYSKEKIKIATARCARISYETLGDNPKIDYEADIKLHDRLLAEGHMSPFEHCAKNIDMADYDYFKYAIPEGFTHVDLNIENFYSGNLKGFIQYRHLIEQND